ncbi:hypothetical protein [Streptomyces hygroscopicus]|uniref:hypothetical protein n=1 Tax=Streptomyces hygroscopicus TaxID=1912 RepID=UPI003A0FC119
MFPIEAARDPRTTGAIIPSGEALAHALTDPVRAPAPRPPATLETGAGAGAATMEMVHPGGTLTYFAYLGTLRARALLASRAEVRRHAAVDGVMASTSAAMPPAIGQCGPTCPQPSSGTCNAPLPLPPPRDQQHGGVRR